MKKIYLKSLLIVGIFTLIICGLNVRVTTKQGINYQVHEIRLPLYLKMLDFIDRSYNYRNLIANILGDTKDDNAKTIKIFNWVVDNIRKQPRELPIIDDHPLNILIRGYGVQDQFEDIFTILCTYAGMEAFFKMFKNHSDNVYFISFVKIKGKWCPFSAFGGVYSIKNGAVASVDDILLDKKLLIPFSSNLSDFETDIFLKEINSMDFKSDSVRVKGQSPAGRALRFIKDMFHRKSR